MKLYAVTDEYIKNVVDFKLLEEKSKLYKRNT